VFKRQALAKSFFVGGTIAIVTDALAMNIPQLAGTGYFIPQRQLSGGVGRTMGQGTPGKSIITRTASQQARYV
jgi:hypothetical protein